MPVSDHDDYEAGHFKRVYEHIIKPACIKAGFEPLRADDVQKSNIIVVDILHKIVNCEMALCDLSSKNPNVLYELGIRQAFDLPVALIKDNVTPRIFDIQGFRDVGYNSSMRVDEVNSAVEQIAEVITATYDQHDTKDNSIISLLSITKASIKEPISLSPEMSFIMDALKSINEKIIKLEPVHEFNSKDLDGSRGLAVKGKENVSADETDLKLFSSDGHNFELYDIVYHAKFGRGTVVKITSIKGQAKAEIEFEGVGTKTLLASFVKLSDKPY